MKKTIRQIADEIGVSKQAIHQKRKKEPLSTCLRPFTSTIDGVIYIDVDGENLIRQAFYKEQPSTPVNSVDANSFTGVDGVIDSKFTDIIMVLQNQLEVKDKQIEQQQKSIRELTSALMSAQQTAQAAQALHAGTLQENLDRLPETVSTKKTGFFQRIFGNNKN